MYDLNIFPIHTKPSQKLSQLAGFQAVSPPRRSTRSRGEDLLIMSLSIGGSGAVSSEVQKAWLDRMVGSFFKTSGSVTSALRALIDTLNLTMMEKNLQLAKEGLAMIGAINLAAIHHRSLYLVQSGLTHAYSLNHQGLQHFTDPSHADRGLGLSRNPTIRYFQTDLGTGGYLFMTDSPPETWQKDVLFSDAFPSVEQLRRRLLNQAPRDFRLDLVQMIPGEGQINIIETAPPARVSSEERIPADQETIIAPAPAPEISSEDKAIDIGINDTQEVRPPSEFVDVHKNAEAEMPPEQGDMAVPPPMDNKEATSPMHTGFAAVSEQTYAPSAPPQKSGLPASEVIKIRQGEAWDEILKALASFFKWWHSTIEKVKGIFVDLRERWLPGAAADTPKLSRASLLWIAVIVPFAVVAIALGVYLARGRTLQYKQYYELAVSRSVSALSAEDPSQARSDWAQTLTYLEQAESYRETDETTDLRKQAQAAMDKLDGAVRLVYRPAISGSLYSEINITRIISYGADLYLFDATGGRVIHATRGDQVYTVDPEFVCAAGNFEGGSVGSLVDMVSLPINNPYQAHILVVDALGKAAYCGPGQDPVVQSLPEHEAGAGEIKRITFESSFLYALNPSANSVRVYRWTNGQFLDPPTDFFGNEGREELPDLSQITDLAVNGPDLYLLKANGALVNCISTGLPGNPVNCENPVNYVDGRPGLEENTVNMPESNFVSILYSSPPDPSVSILDAHHADIYRFSLRFRLYQRLRPEMGDYDLESSIASAFTIGIDRMAFLAFGNQLFFAYIE